MKRVFISIFVLLVFLNFQFGKMANYIHCKWQTAWIQPDCGCDQILVDHFGDEGSPGAIDKEGLKQISTEYHERLVSFQPLYSVSFDTRCYAAYTDSILEPVLRSSFSSSLRLKESRISMLHCQGHIMQTTHLCKVNLKHLFYLTVLHSRLFMNCRCFDQPCFNSSHSYIKNLFI